MRYEYRVTIDVSAYSKPCMIALNQEHVDEMCDMLGSQLEREIEKMFGSFPHVFKHVRLTAVPHDNDLDYTEEDARRHCGRTYLDAVHEALPGCDSTRIKQMCPGWLIPGGPVFTDNGMGKCRYHPLTGVCGDCFMIDCPDNVSEEAQNHDD